jgi:hypothetical protein
MNGSQWELNNSLYELNRGDRFLNTVLWDDDDYYPDALDADLRNAMYRDGMERPVNFDK